MAQIEPEVRGSVSKASRPVTLGDVQEALVLAALAPAAWFVPSSSWPLVTRVLASVTNALVGRPVPELPRDLPTALDSLMRDREAATIRTWRQAAYFEERLQVLSTIGPRGWHPAIEVRGTEHVEAALAAAHGAILWVSDFVSSDLVSKMAASRAGFPPAHLSRPEHGFSRSRWGMRLLNPIRRRAENRYLAERVTMHDAGVAALRTLARRLRQNGVVSITVGAEALRKQSLPFLGGRLTVATGPISLALSTGTPLLPVFTLRRAVDDFLVVVEGDVVPRTGDQAAASELALQRLALVLGDYVTRYPQLWRGWRTVFTES